VRAPGRITSSAGGPGVQSKAARAGLSLALLAALAAAGGCHRREVAPVEGGRVTPSGLPVPRWVSLKYAKVNARGGPGDDYRALWVYGVRGTPLQVVAETDDWRRVCDPDGGVAWVHKRTVEARRTVMRTAPGDLPIHRGPSEAAPTEAVLVSRSLASLDRCRDGWCKIAAAHLSGWVKQGEIWGAADGPACAPTRVTRSAGKQAGRRAG